MLPEDFLSSRGTPGTVPARAPTWKTINDERQGKADRRALRLRGARLMGGPTDAAPGPDGEP